MENKELRLSLKKKWFEMTKAKIKPEDYRDINEYWGKRLISGLNEKWELAGALSELRSGRCIKKVEEDYICSLKKFTINTMTLGYPSKGDTERTLKLEHLGIEIREGNPEWGAEPGKLYFVIKHGKIIE